MITCMRSSCLHFGALALFFILKPSKPLDVNTNTIPKAGNLTLLADHMNTHNEIFSSWSDSEENYMNFFKWLEPWILGNYSKNILHISKPVVSLNCNNPHYSGVLTGKVLASPRIIVDFVPFGYEVDKFFIRLYETSEYVDAFVVFESSRTQTGMHKPLYFSKLKKTQRLKPWLQKIIHFVAHDSELSDLVAKVKHRLKVLRNSGQPMKKNDDLWMLESSMRTKMMEKFSLLDGETHPLKARIMAGLGTALGIQNDADEIIKGEVLYHLKHCEIKSEVSAIYTPAFQFKRNFHWLEGTRDLGCLSQPSFPLRKDLPLFTSHLWRPGPYLHPLATMLAAGHTKRTHDFESDFFCRHHMGVGAAVHISSVADPVDLWMKRCGVVEQVCKDMFPKEFVAAARARRVTPELIIRSSFRPLCYIAQKGSALSVLSLPYRQRAVFEEAVPWIVRSNPDRFPYMLPANVTVTGDKDRSALVRLGLVSWDKLC